MFMFLQKVFKLFKRPQQTVVIPVHKAIMTDEEKISLRQCLNVFSNYTIIFAIPESLDKTEYETFCQKHSNIQFACFDNEWFSSNYMYNQLLVVGIFYERFLLFEYILIYQLDAFVFRDELVKWCDLKYDYIGAPWVNTWRKIQDSSKSNFQALITRITQEDSFVGNGGFSLRKVRGFLWTLLFWGRKAQKICRHEDVFWSLSAAKRNPLFSIAPFNTGLRFSFETSPDICLKLNNGKLPFGCHAWGLHGRDFFEPIVLVSYIKTCFDVGNIEEGLRWVENISNLEVVPTLLLCAAGDSVKKGLDSSARTFLCKICNALQNRAVVDALERYHIASFFKILNKYDIAEQLFKRVINETTVPTLKGNAYYHLAEIYFFKKKYVEALKLFEYCTELNSSHEKAKIYISKVCEMISDKKRETKVF